MLDEIASNTITDMKKVINSGKRGMTLSEVMPVENIILCKKKSLLDINCKTKHVSNRILSDSVKVTPHREFTRTS